LQRLALADKILPLIPSKSLRSMPPFGHAATSNAQFTPESPHPNWPSPRSLSVKGKRNRPVPSQRRPALERRLNFNQCRMTGWFGPNIAPEQSKNSEYRFDRQRRSPQRGSVLFHFSF